MAERTHAISKVHPITFRGDDLVMAWIFNLTLRQGDQEAMDSMTIELAQSARKPLADWTRSEVEALIQQTIAGGAPRVMGLHRTLDARLMIEERMDFDVGSLPE